MSDTATRAAPSKKRPARRWLDFFREPLRRVEADSRAFLASDAARRPDRKVIVVLVSVALSLTVQRFIAMEDGLPLIAGLLRGAGLPALADDFEQAMLVQLNRLTWWSAVSLLVYVVVPMLIVRLVFRERVRDYGVKVGGVFTDFWVYALMMAVAWPAIVLASR